MLAYIIFTGFIYSCNNLPAEGCLRKAESLEMPAQDNSVLQCQCQALTWCTIHTSQAVSHCFCWWNTHARQAKEPGQAVQELSIVFRHLVSQSTSPRQHRSPKSSPIPDLMHNTYQSVSHCFCSWELHVKAGSAGPTRYGQDLVLQPGGQTVSQPTS